MTLHNVTSLPGAFRRVLGSFGSHLPTSEFPELTNLPCLPRFGPAAPVDPQAAGGLNSYIPTTSFANSWGQLALVRCLGSNNPGSLCVYSGYDMPAPPTDAARALQRPAAGAALVAAAAAAVCWLLL